MAILRIRYFKRFFLLSSLLLFLSCEEIANEVLGEAVDCIFPHRPELKGEIMDGKVGEPYSALVTAWIKNSPDEDSFDFAFDLMGSLPDGVQYNIFDRNMRFSGIPKESGTFRFTILVESYDTREESEDGTCLGNNTESKDFVIRIEPSQ